MLFVSFSYCLLVFFLCLQFMLSWLLYVSACSPLSLFCLWLSMLLGRGDCFFSLPRGIPSYHFLLFIQSGLSDSLSPHGLQHARLLCLCLSVCSSLGSLSPCCYLTNSSSAPHFSFSLPSIFPQDQGLCFNESSLHIRWPKALELQLQHQLFQWIFGIDFL